ncbi:MAG: hypothetical protein QXT03_05365 [Desulfurococcaceae archaeon]
MFNIRASFPYIGLMKIPKEIYQQLKRELDDVLNELIDYLESISVEHKYENNEFRVRVGDLEETVNVLAKLHSSFTFINGITSDVGGEYNEYLYNLTNRFNVLYPEILNELSELIEFKKYSEAFEAAWRGLLEVSRSEVLYAKTGRFVDQTVFTLLYGNIPQVNVETYILVEKGSSYARGIAEEIYRMVAEEARRASLNISAGRRSLMK